MFSKFIIGAVTLLAVLHGSTGAQAKVFYSRNEALQLAFPDAERVESKTFVLDNAQFEKIQDLAKCELDSKLVKIYTAMRDGNVSAPPVARSASTNTAASKRWVSTCNSA